MSASATGAVSQERLAQLLTKDSSVRRLQDTLETAVRLRKLAIENRKQLEALRRQLTQRRG